ncbi:MAG TPA: serine/threonine-protein kinase [Kofleriaceae bacterium]|nr:serine/threonine-protein kinase [Kofleriaceae bacterium]
MIGQVLDGHEIVRPIGTGGMGEVYLARAGDGTLRAFKVVRADRADGQAAGRFRREALALARLQHPAIVRILDAGRADTGELYLGMEYVAGPDLQAAVTAEGPLAVADAMKLLARVAAALAYAHAQGIVHRDLKPSNVLLDGGDPAGAKIIDFGLAKIIADEGLTRLTDDGQMLGSPLYWAPEQGLTPKVGPAADVYALGGIAYFALSGAPLFRPRPAVALVYAHANEQPEALASRCAGVEIPRALDELVRACIAKQAAHRPPAELVARELARLVDQLPVMPTRKSQPRLFTASPTSDLEQAVTSQIRQVLLDLAAQLGHPIDEIDRLQSVISERELELAMLESEVDVSLEPQPEVAEMTEVVAALQRELADAFRTLYAAVDRDRARAPREVVPLYKELDELVARLRAP